MEHFPAAKPTISVRKTSSFRIRSEGGQALDSECGGWDLREDIMGVKVKDRCPGAGTGLRKSVVLSDVAGYAKTKPS